jgi:hypothetical protein
VFRKKYCELKGDAAKKGLDLKILNVGQKGLPAQWKKGRKKGLGKEKYQSTK